MSHDIDDLSVEYIKDRYNEASDRFKHIEEKAIKIMTALSFVLAVITAVISEKDLLKFDGVKDWVVSIVVILDLICIFWAWLHALYALKLEEAAVPNRSIDAVEYLVHQPPEYTRHFIINTYSETIRLLEETTDRKARFVEHSYNELRYSGFLSIICFVLYTVKDHIP